MPTPPDTGPPVWTHRRRVIGNLLPILCAAPFGILGLVLMYREGALLGRGFAVFSLTPIVGWLAVNWLGLFENGAMRRAMERRAIHLPDERWFVGAATPTFVGLLDPHEDVGFLWIDDENIGFFGEHLRISIRRASVTSIRFRPNIHSLIGLGRWVSIEAVIDGHPAQLRIEPRERPTLFGNRRLSRAIRDRLMDSGLA